MIEYRIFTKQGFDEVCSKISGKVSSAGFGVLAEIPTGKILRSKGFDYPLMNTYEVCNPSYASKILSFEKSAEVMLPCRIIVKEAENGTEISAQLPTEMLKLIESNKKQELVKIAEEVEVIIKNIVNSMAS
ncbi:MAG: DUF302 domain-containing protein [Candidatus Thermoplasmatota archaeon]|jgi:uncharacterized protein (DUF302 family)|nr:DUF302 domain-containing protein [Candidatus Thermoplasmatota archaeon]